MFPSKAYTWIGLAAVVVAAASALAAPAWLARSWQSDEGLPDNTVVGIEQTPDGFLWVATQTGLVRFDGVRFVPFPLMPESAPSRIIYALCADRLGRVWVALQPGGVVCVEPGGGTTLFSQKDGLPDRLVRMMVLDAEGAVWVTYLDGEVARILNGQVRLFTAEEGLSGEGVCELAVDGIGRLWFSQGNWFGVFREGRFYSLEQYNVERIAGARTGGLWVCGGNRLCKYAEDGSLMYDSVLPAEASEKGPTVLCEDRSGRMWLGTREAGLFCYAGTNFTAVPLWPQTILSLKEDREGNIWVGTRGGGLKQLKSRVAELLTTGASPSFDGVQSICKDTKGQLWAIIWQKGTVVRNVGQNWLPLSATDGWNVYFAKCVAADPQGGVWIGTTFDGLYHWRDGGVIRHLSSTNGLMGNCVGALRTTEQGAVWLGGVNPSNEQSIIQCWEAGKFRTFTLPSRCGVVTAIEVDASGDCWAATARGVLVRIHGDVLTDETANTLSRPHAIRALLATPDNSLWIGYAGMGLGHLKGSYFTHFRMSQGLHDDYISQILSDGRGRLWLAGNRGIFSVREKNLNDLMEGQSAQIQSVVYKQKDGLPGLQSSYDACPGALRDADGRLFFAMQSGVAVLYAEEIKEDPEPPSVVIDRVLANGKAVALYGAGELGSGFSASLELGQPRADLHVPPGWRQIEFSFTVPSFTMPENIWLKYRLEGLDKDWIYSGSRRSALYSQLAPGHYQFQVTACNRDGVWSKQGASLTLTVEPFWWETVWFRVVGPIIAVGVLGGLLLFGLRRRYQFRIEKLELLRAMEIERGRIAADLHDEIGANLTHISILSSLAAKPTTESDAIRQQNAEVSIVARQTILAFDEILWSVNPKNDSFLSLSHYICSRAEEILSPANVTYRFTLDDAIPDRPLSPQLRHGLLLAVKEALHNIIKHARANRVEVKCEMDGGVFVVNVSDNGCGFDIASSPVEVKGRKGHGLENMSRRLVDLGGECRIERRPEGGTQISFRLPID